MVDSAKGLQTAGYHGDQTFFSAFFGGFEQGSQEIRRDAGHIASDNQIPVRGGVAKSGVEAAERTVAFNPIRDYGQAEKSIPLRRTDQRRISGSLFNVIRSLLDECSRSRGKQRFIATHPAAAPAYEYVSGPADSLHETMLTMLFWDRVRAGVRLRATQGFEQRSRGRLGKPPRVGNLPHLINKKLYICLILAIVFMAASPICAAELASSGPSQATPKRQTFIVRVDPRTGKLVRRELSPPSLKPPKMPPAEISNLVDQSARNHGVDPLLVHSVIQVESNYDPNAISPKGAEGLMQLMPQTSRMLGVNNTFDPGENIEAGVKYLRYLQDLYEDDRLALAAYNAGPGAVDKFRAVPPFPETRKYVEKVGQRYGEAKSAVKPAPAENGNQVQGTEPVTQEARYPKLEQFVDEQGRLHLQTLP